MLNDLRFQFLQGQEIFLLCKVSTLALGHPASYSMGIWGFLLGDKQMGCEAGHLTPPGAEVNEWSYNSALLICLYGTQGATLPYAACVQVPRNCPPVTRPK